MDYFRPGSVIMEVGLVPNDTSTFTDVQATCQNVLAAANLTNEVDFDMTEVTGYIFFLYTYFIQCI